MVELIINIIELYWEERLQELMKSVTATTDQFRDFLAVEAHQRGTRADENLSKSVNGFGTSTLDHKLLGSLLQQSKDSRTPQKERYQRLQCVFEELDGIRTAYAETPPRYQIANMENGTEEILETFEHHAHKMTEAFRALRIAALEAHGMYDPTQHDAFFETFDWRQWDNSEFALCPPFIVLVQPRNGFAEVVGSLLQLLCSGKPIKIVILQRRLIDGLHETGREAVLKSSVSVDLLFMLFRQVYFLQSSVAGTHKLEELMGKALGPSRPAVISLYAGATSDESFKTRAMKALRSRTFPHFVYDPDKASDFFSCLDLSENPEVDQTWAREELKLAAHDGEPGSVEQVVTYADFVAADSDYRDLFTVVPQEADNADQVPLAEYLALTAAERQSKRPFVIGMNEKNQAVKLVPSQGTIAATVEKMEVWQILQEFGGVDRVDANAGEQGAGDGVSVGKKKLPDKLTEEMEEHLKSREKAAVAAAMRNLVIKLTGTRPNPDDKKTVD